MKGRRQENQKGRQSGRSVRVQQWVGRTGHWHVFGKMFTKHSVFGIAPDSKSRVSRVNLKQINVLCPRRNWGVGIRKKVAGNCTTMARTQKRCVTSVDKWCYWEKVASPLAHSHAAGWLHPRLIRTECVRKYIYMYISFWYTCIYRYTWILFNSCGSPKCGRNLKRDAPTEWPWHKSVRKKNYV